MKQYASYIAGAEFIISLTLIFVSIRDEWKINLGICFIISILIGYIIFWKKQNDLTAIKLNINNSTVNIFFGDIFKTDGLKVIPFNEYFDTVVDDIIIAKGSLNGIYINTKIHNTNHLDMEIAKDLILKDKIICNNKNRKLGKQNRYKLGSCHLYNDEYILTAFTRFDEDNKAYLYMRDFLSFLLELWNEVDRLYAGRTINIPLLGSGITRFKEYGNISDQELLEIIIWTYKISRVKITYPAIVNFIIHEDKIDKIDLYKIKEDN